MATLAFVTAEAHREEPRWPARTPAGVRAALSGRNREDFERDYRAALDRASSDFDLSPVHGLVERWWRIAVLSDDSAAHQRMLTAVDALRAGRPVASTPWRQARSELSQ
jgi:Family of unknown function (DUF6247)